MRDQQKMLIAVLVLGGGALAYWYYQHQQNSNAVANAQAMQNPAAQAMANYSVPPDIGAQTTAQQVVSQMGTSGPYLQTTQTMPLPYNT